MRHPDRYAVTAGRIAAAAVLLAAAACATSTDTTADTPASAAPTVADTALAAAEPPQPADTTPATTQPRDTEPATTAATEEPQAEPDEAEADETGGSAATVADDEVSADEDDTEVDDGESEGGSAPEQDTSQEDEIGEADDAEAEPETDDEDTAGDETAEPATEIDRIRGLLGTLTVAPEAGGGYNRDLFKHWIDADRDGCDARREVLIAEATRVPQIGSRCALSDGEWLSRYDGKTTAGTGRGFDVDHLVPLQEAWQSGARDWEPALREHFANFLDYRDALVAVSASSNRSKGARDPAEWLPPSAGVHCWYATAWIHVKNVYALTIDQAEADTLTRILDGCDDDDLDVWPQAQAAPDDDTEDETESSVEGSEAEEAAPETDPVDDDCHPAYEPCLPNLPGDAPNCGDLTADQKPVRVKEIGVDPYRLDRDNNGWGCTS